MDVQNCRECGRLFNYLGGQRLCPGCKAKLEDKFQKVKTYYDEGLWSIQRVRNAVVKNWITEAEFEQITGKNYGDDN